MTRRGDYHDAERQFERVLDHEPEHFLARLLQGVCCLRQHHLAEARIALTAAIAQRPRFHWSYLFRSQVHRESGDFVSAIGDLETALSCQPPAPEGYAALMEAAQVWRQQKHDSKARDLLERAVQLLPSEPAARRELDDLEGRAR